MIYHGVGEVALRKVYCEKFEYLKFRTEKISVMFEYCNCIKSVFKFNKVEQVHVKWAEPEPDSGCGCGFPERLRSTCWVSHQRLGEPPGPVWLDQDSVVSSRPEQP